MPSLPCVVAFSLVDLKTFGPLALRSSPFYLVHPAKGCDTTASSPKQAGAPPTSLARFSRFPPALALERKHTLRKQARTRCVTSPGICAGSGSDPDNDPLTLTWSG